MSRNCVRCETRYYGQILLKLHILTTPQYPVQREILSCCVLSDHIYTQTWNLPLNTHYCRKLLSDCHLIGCLFRILPAGALRLHNIHNLGFIFTESQGNFLVLIIQLIDWLIDWLIDQLIDWLIDRQVFAMGKTNRATAITDMNEHSSRSHALLCVTVIGVNRTTGHRTTGNNQFDRLKSPFATHSVICVVLL